MEKRCGVERVILGVILILAACFDYRDDRIPNKLCLSGSAAGMIVVLYGQGILDGLFHLVWVAGLCVCLFPLWMLRVAGAGDVKLMMTVGVLLGRSTIPFLICSGACLGLHAIVIMLLRKSYFRRMAVFFRYAMECWSERKLKPYPFEKKRDAADGGIRISYGLLAGHLLAMVTGMY